MHDSFPFSINSIKSHFPFLSEKWIGERIPVLEMLLNLSLYIFSKEWIGERKSAPQLSHYIYFYPKSE